MFTTLLLLTGPTVGFRLLGRLGISRFVTWRASVTHGLAVMLVATATAHFIPPSVSVMPSHDDLAAMVPPFVPFPHVMVYVTGLLELLGAAGLVRTVTRPMAGIGLAVLFVLMLPANIHAAIEHIPFDGDPATPLWFRIPEQLLFITIALWAARTARETPHRHWPAAIRPGTDDAAAARQ
ncbi:DoxX family protein [Streptomyces europaeiscabiei]|uniref:DoxX family protein n=1 Tax=Streptomyces europaeiscabiei TaxID=146819 RepID=UPI0038F74410